MTAPTIDAPHPLRRWDPLVKLTHWGIVAGVVANALFTKGGSVAHVWFGYEIAGLLSLRLAWGLIGPARARFSAFPPSPKRAMAHVREILAGHKTRHKSHNPLGSLMVYAIWSCLAVIIASGVGMAGFPPRTLTTVIEESAVSKTIPAPDREEESNFKAGEPDGEDREEGPAGEIHEAAVNLLYLLITLHLAGVIFETRRSGREIVESMLPGR